MMILYRYLFKRFMIGFLVSLVVLVSIEVFFSFTAELKYLGKGNYGMSNLLKYSILSLPKSLLIMFPYAVLIGAMLSLGSMAADMEFISMHASGISISKIIIIILLQAFLLSSFFYTIADSVVPEYTSKAEIKKNIMEYFVSKPRPIKTPQVSHQYNLSEYIALAKQKKETDQKHRSQASVVATV